MNIDNQIEAWCDNYIQSHETPIEGPLVIYNVQIVSVINNKHLKTVFDVCIFRDAYIYDITNQESVSKDDYTNSITNSFCKN